MISTWRRECVSAAVSVLALAFGVVSAQAQTTALFIDSEPGDRVGRGRRETWTNAHLTFDRSVTPNRTGVTIVVHGSGSSIRWDLQFIAPGGLPLAPGIYEAAGRAPMQGTNTPGLNISSTSGFTCYRSAGRFQVYEVDVDGTGALTRFAADFEQRCEDATPALFGAIRYSSTVSSLNPFSGAYPVYSLEVQPAEHGYVVGPGIECGAGRTDCHESYARDASIAVEAVASPGYVFLGWAGVDCVGEAVVAIAMSRRRHCAPVFNAAPGSLLPESPSYAHGAFFFHGRVTREGTPPFDGQARQVYLELPPGNPNASAVIADIASPHDLRLRVSGPGTDIWNLWFIAPPGEVLAPGSYSHTVVAPHVGGDVPTLWIAGTSAGCENGGRFVVHEILFSAGVLTRFAADFEAPCGTPGAMAAGSVRYRSTRASLMPFDGDYPQFSIDIVATTGGYVAASGIQCGDGGRTDCRESYSAAASLSLVATASPGYVFAGWTGSCSGAAVVANINVDHIARCFAVFTPATGSSAPADPAIGAATLFVDRTRISGGRRIWMYAHSPLSATSYSGGSVVEVVGVGNGGIEVVRFGSATGRLVPGEYEGASSARVGPAPFLELNCPTTRGRFRVYEASFDGEGRVASFAADFEAFCGFDADSHIVGAVRFNSQRPRILPFDGLYPIFKLTIDAAANGFVTGTGIDCGAGRTDCVETYGTSTAVVLRAVASPGFRFVGWGGACGGASVTTVTVNWIRRCGAVFNPIVPGRGPEDPRTRNTALFIDSQPGDPVGEGRRHAWLDGTFFASSLSPNVARLSISLPEIGYWTLEFRAPGSEELRTGLYAGATHAFSFGNTSPGLYISSPNGSCSSTLTGRFFVHEVRFLSSQLVAFAADFELRCVSGGPALFGSVRFNSSRSELRPFPPIPDLSARNDFNADGRLDLFWQNRADGQLGAWFMAGLTRIDDAGIDHVADTHWHIVGTGDGNRDGRTDLYWQHQTTGALAIWYMYETARLSAEPLSPGAVADTQWKIRTVTDLDQDGSPDLIWQHTGTGNTAVWFMNGRHLRSADALVPGRVADLNWTIVAAGDVNRDGNPDLFWQHAASGDLAVWFMRGRTLLAADPLSPARVVDTNWKVRGAGDLDGNGTPDLIWQNTATLQVAAWLLSGLRSTSAQVITGPALPNASWHIVGPR